MICLILLLLRVVFGLLKLSRRESNCPETCSSDNRDERFAISKLKYTSSIVTNYRKFCTADSCEENSIFLLSFTTT